MPFKAEQEMLTRMKKWESRIFSLFSNFKVNMDSVTPETTF